MSRLYNRRHFIRDVSLGTAALLPAISAMAACSSISKGKKLGVALVGLGSYSTYQLAPALLKCENCYLAGIVTGTPAKEKVWAEKYNIPQQNIYNYENFDDIVRNAAIDIVYVVLPVAMHKEYTIRAAKAGKHVICEKPMAVSAADCQEMIDACKKANKMLSIGYRLHFDPFNIEMMRLGQKRVYGKILKIDSANGFTWGGDPNAWRLKKALAGGGALMDMGVYVVQGARYTTGEEPIAVTAREIKTNPNLFREVDETVVWEMKFPGEIVATCKTSYNESMSFLNVEAEKGWFKLSPAFGYGGLSGETSDGKMNITPINQQAAQMDNFAQCILQNKPTRVPGEMGLQDIKIIEAIYRSIASGKEENI